jgi:hypothetical protein
MDPSPVNHEFEPFGQRGVRDLIRPTFVLLCGIAVAISAAMYVRSQMYFDLLWRVNDGHSLQIASAIGRMIVTRRAVERRFSQDETWTYESAEITSMEDGWAPSIYKTIGIQWGEEQGSGWGGRTYTYWRLRIQWRTILIVAGVPLIVDAALRRRATRRAEAQRLAEERASQNDTVAA